MANHHAFYQWKAIRCKVEKLIDVSKIKFNFSWINDCFDTTKGRQLLNLGNGIFQKVMEKVMESHGILRGQVYQPCHGNSTNFILM